MMRRLAPVILVTLLCAAQTVQPQSTLQDPAQIVVPAGTTISLALTRPVWAKAAKTGDTVYAEIAFPIAVHNQMAIPPGTYAEGQIDALTRPRWFSFHAQFQIHFTKLIFANGYTVELANMGTLDFADDVIAAVANPYVRVSSANDILLDNGAQIEMVLQVPLQLNAGNVAGALRRTNPASIGPFKSATLCRTIPGTPATPDRVISGIPSTPATPDTVIHMGADMPDIVIPGNVAMPGTPDTIIPGDPATMDVTCPGPPVVTSNPKVQSYRESFHIDAPAQISGKQLSAGSYQVTWKGSGPLAQVDIFQNGSVVFSVRARVVLLNRKSPADAPETRTNSDGSVWVQSLRFAGQTFALYFDRGAA
jgi:hypothetical protein